MNKKWDSLDSILAQAREISHLQSRLDTTSEETQKLRKIISELIPHITNLMNKNKQLHGALKIISKGSWFSAVGPMRVANAVLVDIKGEKNEVG